MGLNWNKETIWLNYTFRGQRNYISDDEFEIEMESQGKVKPDSKMGYLSTVEDARESLETLYKLKDIKES